MSEPVRAADARMPSRRRALKALGAFAAGSLAATTARSSAPDVSTGRLRAAPATARLVPDARPPTPVWAYDESVPGTTLRAAQGGRLSLDFVNDLPDASTVHWHGIRLPNAMDGVPYLTQPPVAPGAAFLYEFALPDAGTYWYHPHLGAPEQLGRGLYGALIIAEVDPPAVDRDLLWVLGDWRLDGQARIFDDFYRWSDVAFDGRIGNTVTVNGREHFAQTVVPGERVRLRLINAANARLFSLNFGDHPVWRIALDGHPLAAPEAVAADENVFLGPGQRADLIIDMTGRAGMSAQVLVRLRPQRAYAIARLDYRGGASLAMPRQRSAPAPLAPNPLAEIGRRERLQVALEMDGGMMSAPSEPWLERAARRLRRWSGAREADAAWSINGHAHMAHGPEHAFAFTIERGRTVELAFRNRSSFWHPMHVHGHTFRELSRNGRPIPGTPWRDTTMVAPDETLVVAFVADNPGDWLIHCHILEHHAGGMGTQFRVR
jgi:FtsP/CotA-like multicopper oxidase with cupredoxin domain